MTSSRSVRYREIVVDYPLCLVSICREDSLSKTELIEAIIWGFAFSRDTHEDYRSCGNFIDQVEYFLQHDKESEMADPQESVEWYNFLEWLETDFVYDHLRHWARYHDFFKIGEDILILPYNSRSFKIRIS